MNFIDIIDNHGAVNGQKAAHIYRDTILTYKELQDTSDALAVYLIEQFGRDKAPVIVYGHKQHEMIICFLACTKSGHAYIPVDTSFPYERVNDIVGSSESRIIFNIGGLDFGPCGTIVKSAGEINEIITEYRGRRPDKSFRVMPEDPYYMLYTSGSTGKPKGVQITLSCLEKFLDWYMKISNFEGIENFVFMNQVSYSFDVSIMDLYVSLIHGATLFAIDKEMIANFKDMFENFKKSNMSIWISTPSMIEMCLIDESFNRELLPNLKLIALAGEVLTNNCVQKLFDRFGDIRIINGYGPTESTVLVTAVEIDRDMCQNVNPLPIGYPMDYCKIHIEGPDGREVPEGDKGEIVIIGDTVSPGYYKNEEMTQKVFFKRIVDGIEKRCYRTGDEGYIKDGLVFYSGRMDFQVKLNGFRIELGDVENNLRRVDIVKNAVVLPISKNGKVQYLAAAVTLNKPMEEKEFKIGLMIKNELKKFIPDYMIPRKIVIKESFPVNVNGKADRKLLMEEIK